MLQHGCSWSGDHHTSVKQTTVRKKIRSVISNASKKIPQFITCVVTASLRAEKTAVYMISI